jgi:hypothetical protein
MPGTVDRAPTPADNNGGSMSKPKQQKSRKIDCRMTEALWEQVETFAAASHLSRSQVVERALLQYFGESVAESPADIRPTTKAEGKEPPNNGPRIGFHAKKGNGPSASLKQTGSRAT